MRNDRANRDAARLANQRIFYGDQCQRCGGTERYTISGACAVCIRTAALNRSRNKDVRLQAQTNQIPLNLTDVPPFPADSCCQCCGQQTRKLMVDHDHELVEFGFSIAEAFRGWVCSSCNVALGSTYYKRLTAYLKESKKKNRFCEK